MKERELFERLADALDASPSPAQVDADVAELLAVADELRLRPRNEFRARLAASLAADLVAAPKPATRPASSFVPAGAPMATPCLILKDAAKAIDFYKEAFGAVEVGRSTDKAGNILHAGIRIGDSPIDIAPEVAEWGNIGPDTLGGTSISVALYVEDVDAVFARAVAAGATVLDPVQDYFYGDRGGKLKDPFGHRWMVATHKEDVSIEEMQRRMNKLYGVP